MNAWESNVTLWCVQKETQPNKEQKETNQVGRPHLPSVLLLLKAQRKSATGVEDVMRVA